ncbi:MAG: hypothetical protein JSS49_24560 [Planctomycetes bacterium]|nr:hypothetical protein [Planctomycetota bacterium]
MTLLPDGKTLRVVSKLDEVGRTKLYEQFDFPDGIQLDKVLNHHWIRTSPSFTSPANRQDNAEIPDITGTWGEGKWIRQSPKPSVDEHGKLSVEAVQSPVSQPFLQQIAASESAAAAEAQLIRALKANGQAESRKGAMADHQRKLNSLLNSAFDLKLQSEELQVKELQSRLSRLDRQIGQRKLLREKIIERRTAELLEGEALKWESGNAPPSLQSEDAREAPQVNHTSGSNVEVATRRLEIAPAYYQDLARKYDLIERAVRDAEDLVKTTEIFVAKQVKSNSELAAARRQLDDAIHSRSLMKDEYKAVVRDLELQVNSAKAEVEAATLVAMQAEQLFKTASISNREVVEAQLKRTQTRIAMERVQMWLQVSIKAGERITESQRKPVSSATDVPATPDRNPAAGSDGRPKLPQPATPVKLLIVIQNDRDSKLILAALKQLSTLKLDGEPASFGADFVNAIAFHDLDYPHQEGQPSLDYYATEVLKKMSPSTRIAAATAALQSNKSSVSLVGIWGLHVDASLWKYADEPGFPELAEQIFAATKNENPHVRNAAMSFLATTLPFAKIDPADLTTEERRNTIQRFADSFPREKVEQVIIDGVSDKDADVVLDAVFLLKGNREKLADPKLSSQCAVLLAQILDGKFHDTSTTPSQRGRAMSAMAILRSNAAPAVPTLIRLLKSNEFPVVESTERVSRKILEDFSRRKVLLTLGTIGPAAKDALPILEDELKLAERKEREESLLGNSRNGRGGMSESRLLQGVIRSLKGEQPSMFWGDTLNLVPN